MPGTCTDHSGGERVGEPVQSHHQVVLGGTIAGWRSTPLLADLLAEVVRLTDLASELELSLQGLRTRSDGGLDGAIGDRETGADEHLASRGAGRSSPLRQLWRQAYASRWNRAERRNGTGRSDSHISVRRKRRVAKAFT